MTIQPPQNVFQLSASGQVEVQQDMLTLTLVASREGADAASVQTQLRTALDEALAAAKKTAQAGQMDVRTGNFSVNPRYDRHGKIGGWHGRAELVLQGRDFPRITSAAARVESMTIGDVDFGLSREQRAKTEAEAQTQAIERFKARAADITRAFGFAGYTLREVSVDSQGEGYGPRPYMRAAAAEAVGSLKSAPVAVEPGTSVVQVTVSGSVQAK
ncbi:DUF541 domain-containing protein [Comamonadaceae bacterium OH2545_COT-014]|nr:DUF541 domain-containing protein [Comamonadaceae bacterium OH2545_COT-014]